MTLAVVTAVADRLEPDGSQVVAIVTPEGQTIEAEIPAKALARFFQVMQTSLIERALAPDAGSVDLPELGVTGLKLANQGPTAGILISTRQTGSFVLVLSDDKLASLKEKVDLAVLHRSALPSTN